MKFIFSILLGILLYQNSSAQLIQQFSFPGSNGNEVTLPPNGQPVNGTLSSIRRGSGITPPTGSAVSAFGATGFTISTTPDTADYFEFSIKANSGFVLNLDSIIIAERRSNTGIRKFSVRSGLDNFNSNISTFSIPDSNTYRYNQKTLLGASFKNISSSVNLAFRFLGYEAEAETGTWRVDSIRVYGQILNTGPSLPELKWLTTQASIVEGNSNTINVGISAVSTLASNFQIVQKSGTISGSDYNLGTLNASNIGLPAGQSSVGITINALTDALTENSENASWVIRSLTPGILIGPDSIFNLTITDPIAPGPPTCTFSVTSQSVSENGDSIKVIVNLSPAANSFRQISVVQKSGTAVLGTDYTSIFAINTLFFPPGTTSLTYAYKLLDDFVPDGNKTLIVALRKPLSGTTIKAEIGPDSIQTITIIDNDSPVVVDPFPPTRTIAQIKGANTGNQADSVGKNFRIYGTVYGLNTRLSPANAGYNMHLRDATGGIGIFKTTNLTNVPVLNEGDSIKIMGNIGAFRGQSQIVPDSIVVIATGKPLKNPDVVAKPSETTESNLIRINGVQLVNPALWTTGTGLGGFTVRVFKGTDTTDVRIDNDGPLYNQPAPTGTFDIIGMGGQFVAGNPTPTPPFQPVGYQITPRRTADLILAPATNPTARFSVSAQSVSEATDSIRVTITLNPVPTASAKVDIAIKSGTASAGSDYVGTTPATLVFGAGVGSTIFKIKLLEDVAVEGNENLVFVLRTSAPSAIANALSGSDSIQTVTILDNDSPVVVEPFPPTRTIAQIKGASTGNQADSVGKNFRIYGTVYGLNTRLSPANAGYNMHLRDATGGIGIFKTSNLTNVPVLNEGDSIKIMGTIGAFRGQSQIVPDSIVVIATGKPLKNPDVVAKPSETTESNLIRINGVQLVNPALWTTGTGLGGFTVRVFKGTDTTDVRIDNDGPLYNQPAPTGTFDIIGMGGQFVAGNPTPTPPFQPVGYQITPRRTADLIPVVGINPLCQCETKILAYPNPGNNELILENKAKGKLSYLIYNGIGKSITEIKKANDFEKIDTHLWPIGVYYIQIAETGKIIKWLKYQE